MKNKKYNFTLVLENVSNQDDTDIAEILFESGCDDATLSIRDQIAYLEFDRIANSLQNAIVSAVTNVLDADIGAWIIAIDPGDFVTSTEIGRRIKKSRQYIQKLKTVNCKTNSFPGPVAGIQTGNLIYSWKRISYYFYKLGKYIQKEDVINAQLLEIFNEILKNKRHQEGSKTYRHIIRQFTNPKILRQINEQL